MRVSTLGLGLTYTLTLRTQPAHPNPNLRSDAAQCRGLLDADGAARRGEGVIAMSSWPAALMEVRVRVRVGVRVNPNPDPNPDPDPN